jgi:hypothetical protein
VRVNPSDSGLTAPTLAEVAIECSLLGKITREKKHAPSLEIISKGSSDELLHRAHDSICICPGPQPANRAERRELENLGTFVRTRIPRTSAAGYGYYSE